MKRKAPKRHLPAWISVTIIGVVVLIMMVIGFLKFGVRRDLNRWTPEKTARMQELINQGIQPPFLPRERLEKMGVKYPADFEQRVVELRAKHGGTRGIMKTPVSREGK